MTPSDCLGLYSDAAFYDLEFAGRNHELPFYLDAARSAGGPVLEVACGTGRLTLPLAAAGLDICGLDLSPAMLEQARARAQSSGLRVEWLLQDCRKMEVGRKFALIFIATNALQHLLDLESVAAFLQSARRHLKDGGELLLDVFSPNPAKLARPRSHRYLHKEFDGPENQRIQVHAASEYQASSQILRFELTYQSQGRLLRTKHVAMRCFFPEELVALLRWNGFEVSRRYGDYSRSPFTDDSPKQLLFCRPIPRASR